ncbi:MAG: VOC family protein [Alphaproteobacteria bacterium]|nr:VOC family protein [Alphaproteobacteria bacterium]
MSRMIFVNLPVADLRRSVAFYEAVGFTVNPQFTDETAACMVLSDEIHVMLLTHDKYRMFTSKEIADAHRTSAVLLCISCDSRAAVDDITEAALAHGSREPSPKDEYSFMYGRSFEDPDGHCWAPMWLDMGALGDRSAAEVAAEQCA